MAPAGDLSRSSPMRLPVTEPRVEPPAPASGFPARGVLATGDPERLKALGADPLAVARAAELLVASLRAGGKLLIAGNGGSAADAQHMAAELVGRFECVRPGLAAVALTTDSSALTAIANDFGFEQAFARQVQALGRPGDVLLVLSTSGRSPNVLAAVAAARRAGLSCVGLAGPGPHALAEAVDVSVTVPGASAAAIQEVHLVVEHAICRALDGALADGVRPAGPPCGVVELDALLAARERWRASGRTVVWTNGCFDLLHAGHLSSLQSARALGDVLVVGVNDDASVRGLKGEGRPLVPQGDRAALLAALRPVDAVLVFGQATPVEILTLLQPDVHVKGADYAPPDGKPIPERALVEGYGGRVAFLPLLEGRSTTRLAKRLADHG